MKDRGIRVRDEEMMAEAEVGEVIVALKMGGARSQECECLLEDGKC